MFSMFFGGGNFVLPPLLGLKAGDSWAIVALAFGISGVFIPLLGVFVQAKMQGTMVDIGKKIHPIFGLIIGILMYGICLAFPVPRTASVTYELAASKYFSISPILFSIIYFSLVMYLCFNRSKILDILGKFLTPILLGILMLIIIRAVFFIDANIPDIQLKNPFNAGLLEGYQTFDGIASIIIGSVIITSLNLNQSLDFQQKKQLTIYAGLISGFALFVIYTGFIYTGATLSEKFPSVDNISRTEVLSEVSLHTLGDFGKTLLNTSVSIACFTTAVGIITGAGDFLKTIFGNSDLVYRLTVILSCILGVVVGHTGTDNIIAIAVPLLVLIYPIIVMLIFLNFVSEQYTSKRIFRMVITTTFLFSLPDFLTSIGVNSNINEYLPLSSFGLAWLIPSLIIWALGYAFKKK